MTVLKGHDAASDDLGALLLRHLLPILTAFRQAAPSVTDDRLEVPSAELVKALCQTDDAPWGEITHGRPLSQHRLATLLAPFRVWPQQMGREARKRGYLWLRLIGVCRAYLLNPPPTPPPRVSRCSDARKQLGHRGNLRVSRLPRLDLRKHPEARSGQPL